MAHVYSHLFACPHRAALLHGLRAVGTPGHVAGAVRARHHGRRPIPVFNHGDMQRDFTYVDDIVEGTLRVLARPAPYEIYNIGNHTPVALLDYIAALEKAWGRKRSWR
jgi:UDP-glucuronate 4-epimerase